VSLPMAQLTASSAINATAFMFTNYPEEMLRGH
jgi:hypothetical protein